MIFFYQYIFLNNSQEIYLKKMFIINGFIIGITATLLFDIYQQLLSYSYDLNKPKWHIIGRYFWGLKDKKIFQDNIENENVIKYEIFIGYFAHYLIGSLFGLIYISINLIFVNQPSLFIALFVGFSTVLGSWCLLMPFAFNIGFFGSKKENQFKLMIQNLMAHFIFGVNRPIKVNQF